MSPGATPPATMPRIIAAAMLPVPMTLQTLAVMLVGALYGWRLGVLTILVWLALGALGLPVLAGGTGGIARFLGPTGGYLLAFPFAGALTGWLAERGWNGERMALAFAAMLIAHALCLLLGGAWLATTLGMQKAVAVGVVPFVPGAVVTSDPVVSPGSLPAAPQPTTSGRIVARTSRENGVRVPG